MVTAVANNVTEEGEILATVILKSWKLFPNLLKLYRRKVHLTVQQPAILAKQHCTLFIVGLKNILSAMLEWGYVCDMV